MNKIISTLLFASVLSGCIKLQMPDDLISDTVDAIKGDKDEETQTDTESTNTFTHSVVGPVDSLAAELAKACLLKLEARAKEQLGTSELTFTVVSESTSISGDKAIANCTVSID